MKPFVIIHNPTAGGRKTKTLDMVVRLLESHGSKIQLHQTKGPGDACNIVQGLIESQIDLAGILIAGGDGTVLEALQGYPDQYDDKLPALGLLPMGTANVLARELGVAVNPLKAARQMMEAKTVPLFPAKANGKRFMLMVGAGFDALAVAGVDGPLKRRYGALAYVIAAFRALKSYKDMTVNLTIDGVAYRGASVIVTRAKKYAGPFVIAPDADLKGRDLYVLLMETTGLWALFRYGLALIMGRLSQLGDVRVVKASHVTLLDPKGFPTQIDGDIAKAFPLDIEVADIPVPFLLPKG
jgi:YegS/Rv2252/BmrU family lipid kinase